VDGQALGRRTRRGNDGPKGVADVFVGIPKPKRTSGAALPGLIVATVPSPKAVRSRTTALSGRSGARTARLPSGRTPRSVRPPGSHRVRSMRVPGVSALPEVLSMIAASSSRPARRKGLSP
jgi:hypothetical protein